MPIAPEGRFAISLNTHQLSWTYFYSAASRDEDWATPQGSRELDHRLPEASAVTEPAFWLAPPKHVLNADLLCVLWEEAVSLSQLVDTYNGALTEDLHRARDYALGATRASS